VPTFQLFDSSVLIPWLRTRNYEDLVATAFAARRFVLSTVVWMELYAGTRQRADKQDLDRMVRALAGIGRVVAPEPEDFYAAGQVVAFYIRRYGQIAPRDHTNDILIALGAWRADAELVTVNRQDMERWQRLLRRTGKRVTLRITPIPAGLRNGG
jgi:predicted nucleic acid-binding protein